MTTPSVQYRYANGSGNQIRPTRTTYPNGRELNLDYGSVGGQADLLSRVSALIDNDGTTHLADYSYLGLGRPVITDYTQPDVMYTLVGTAGGNDPDTGDIYRGFDRFGRVKDAYWRDYGASADAGRIQYGYDRAGNRTYRADPVAVANGAQYEELYGYDAIQRLKTMDRGTLNGGHTGLTAKSFDQCWTLDPTGNWKGFRQDDTGDGVWDLIQARTSNPVNEITNIANSAGSAWANPAYDAAGNMTTMPQPADPTKSYTAKYDAWNRLVKLQDGANTVAEYQYDARNYRTVAKSYTGGVLSETRHAYYTTNWQAIEERLGTSPDSAAAERQFVWGLRYIDDLVLRDRDTNGDGTLDERLYALQDGNWNVIALTDTSGDVQERYAYQAYGTPKFLTPVFGDRASSSYSSETLFCGYRFEVATRFFHVRHRVYTAALSLWFQRDPVEYYGSKWNLYQYVGSVPVRYIDPDGLDPITLYNMCEHNAMADAWSEWRRYRRWRYGFNQFRKRNRCAGSESWQWQQWKRGCVGVSSCYTGVDCQAHIQKNPDDCFDSLKEAKAFQATKTCEGKNQACKPSKPVIIELATKASALGEPGCWNRFDMNYYDQENDIWLGADDSFASGNEITSFDTKDQMLRKAGWFKTYCVICEGPGYEPPHRDDYLPPPIELPAIFPD